MHRRKKSCPPSVARRCTVSVSLCFSLTRSSVPCFLFSSFFRDLGQKIPILLYGSCFVLSFLVLTFIPPFLFPFFHPHRVKYSQPYRIIRSELGLSSRPAFILTPPTRLSPLRHHWTIQVHFGVGKAVPRSSSPVLSRRLVVLLRSSF